MATPDVYVHHDTSSAEGGNSVALIVLLVAVIAIALFAFFAWNNNMASIGQFGSDRGDNINIDVTPTPTPTPDTNPGSQVPNPAN